MAKVVGNVHGARPRRRQDDGSVVGDISTARISIEDGAHFKGRIEIDPASPNPPPTSTGPGSLIVAAGGLALYPRKVCFPAFEWADLTAQQI